MKRIVHKAVRPKKDFINPTLCIAKLSEAEAHERSRTDWKKVTCRKCLDIAGRMSYTQHLINSGVLSAGGGPGLRG